MRILVVEDERKMADYRRSLREIENQAGQMTTLTESMLTIARADFEGFDMPLAATDLNHVVAEEVRQNQARAAAKGVRLNALPECSLRGAGQCGRPPSPFANSD
jgi:signal transduction histidine kinase